MTWLLHPGPARPYAFPQECLPDDSSHNVMVMLARDHRDLGRETAELHELIFELIWDAEHGIPESACQSMIVTFQARRESNEAQHHPEIT